VGGSRGFHGGGGGGGGGGGWGRGGLVHVFFLKTWYETMGIEERGRGGAKTRNKETAKRIPGTGSGTVARSNTYLFGSKDSGNDSREEKKLWGGEYAREKTGKGSAQKRRQ